MKRFVSILSVFAFLTTSVAGADVPPPATGMHGMVVTEQADATKVGLAVLQHGGNAIDAAVAVGYALAVTDPCCGNIGGGGFMLIHRAKGGETFINFRERAPLHATADMYLDAQGNVVPERSTKTWLAIGVPGTVAGLERARSEYGTMSRTQLLAPAIALARDGFVLGRGDADVLAPVTKDLARQPNSAAIFTDNGAPLRAGTRWRQPQLAKSLALIAHDGPDAFYRGPIARTIVAASAANGGILTLDDFRAYTVEEGAPVTCTYHGYTIVSAPPPSSGGTTLCEILGIVAPFPFSAFGYGSLDNVQEDVEAERLAYADRNTYLGDPDFVKNPVDQLLAPAYLAAQRAKIVAHPGKSANIHGGLGPPEHNQTTHYSIVDGAGNAVSVTYTINDDFGSDLVAGDTGILMNNEMDDFTSKPGVPNLYGLVQGEANAIAPGKRPLSSMAPTIALKDGKVAIVAGSPGGSRIITIVLSVLQNIIDFGMNPQAAVDAPRFHHQWLPDTVYIEKGAVSAEVRGNLLSEGYRVIGDDNLDDWGVAEAITIDPKTGIISGGSDHRRLSGLAAGY